MAREGWGVGGPQPPPIGKGQLNTNPPTPHTHPTPPTQTPQKKQPPNPPHTRLPPRQNPLETPSIPEGIRMEKSRLTPLLITSLGVMIDAPKRTTDGQALGSIADGLAAF